MVVKNSERVWASEGVLNSEDISNSSRIVNSKRVTDGHIVSECEDVKSSTHIFKSHRVNKSDYVYKGVNVVHSRDVAYSAAVAWSEAILSCNRVDDSKLVYRSNDVVDVYCCGFLDNCRSCLFCSGLKNKEYCIFNKEVDERRFEQVKESFLFEFADEIERSYVLNYDKYKGLAEVNGRYDELFDALGARFFDWAADLDEFTEDIFMQVFLRRKTNE